MEKRAEHVVMECDRVNQAVKALKKGDVVEVTVPAGIIKFEILDISI